jgi:hypothetical protein
MIYMCVQAHSYANKHVLIPQPKTASPVSGVEIITALP